MSTTALRFCDRARLAEPDAPPPPPEHAPRPVSTALPQSGAIRPWSAAPPPSDNSQRQAANDESEICICVGFGMDTIALRIPFHVVCPGVRYELRILMSSTCARLRNHDSHMYSSASLSRRKDQDSPRTEVYTNQDSFQVHTDPAVNSIFVQHKRRNSIALGALAGIQVHFSQAPQWNTHFHENTSRGNRVRCGTHTCHENT